MLDAAESLHPLESFAEDVSPLVERTRELIVNVEVGLDDLAREGAEAAAFLVGAFIADIEGRPLPKRVKAVEAGELFAAMEPEDAFRLPFDHRQDEALLGREVVVELRSADAGGAAELVVVRGVDALGVDELRGVLQDPGTRRLPLVRELAWLPAQPIVDFMLTILSKVGLTAQSCVVLYQEVG